MTPARTLKIERCMFDFQGKVLKPAAATFLAMHGAELDLLLLKDGRKLGVECKRADAPRMTRSMRIALDDLELDRLVVVYPGERSYPLGERVVVVPLGGLAGGDGVGLVSFEAFG